MTAYLLLLAPAFPAQSPQPATVASEVAPMPAIIPDAKQLAAWVADLSSKEYELQKAARDALIRSSVWAKDAVPALIKLLDATETRVNDVAEILAAIGPNAKAAVPHLLARMKPDRFGYLNYTLADAVAKIDGPKPEATYALLLSGAKCTEIILDGSGYLRDYAPRVVPHLVDLCGHKDAVVRQKAVRVLAQLDRSFNSDPAERSLMTLAGESATKRVPATMLKLLEDPDVTVRLAACRAVSRLVTKEQGAEKCIPVVVAIMRDDTPSPKIAYHEVAEIFRPMPDAAADALIPLFNSEKDSVRWLAINSVAMLPIHEQLESALKDGKAARTRQAAAIALGERATVEKSAEAVLKASLDDKEFAVRFAAAEALVKLGGRTGVVAPAVVPVLIEGLKHDDERVRVDASTILLRVGTPAKTAIPDLKRLLKDEKSAVALEAGLALVDIDLAEAADAVAALTRGLSESESSARRAAGALAKLGPVAKAAIPELVKQFDAKNVHLRMAVAEAAARIDPAQAAKATEVFVALLKDKKHKSSMVRTYATQSLLRIGSGAKPAVPTLLELLNDDGPFHGEIALAAIAIDSDAAKSAHDWVQQVLSKETATDETYDLIESFGMMRAKAKPFVPVLVTMLGSKSPHLRRNAIVSLGEIGAEAKEALPALKELAANGPQNQRRIAAQAVKEIEAK